MSGHGCEQAPVAARFVRPRIDPWPCAVKNAVPLTYVEKEYARMLLNSYVHGGPADRAMILRKG